MTHDFETELAAWVERRKAEQQARRVARAATMRRLQVRTPLPMPRVWLHGPRWRQCLVTYRTNTGRLAHHPRMYDFLDDVRELVCEQIRFDVYAEWSDARERWRS